MSGLSNASTSPSDSKALWNYPVSVATLGFYVASPTAPLQSSKDLDQGGSNDGSRLRDYPRILTAAQVVEDSDDDSCWCGPPSEQEDNGKAEMRALVDLDLPSDGTEAPPKERLRQERKESIEKAGDDRPTSKPIKPQLRRAPLLIQARGDVQGDNQKFVCVFRIGLDNDENFCLVKRILGKEGNNMRRIAEECNARLRLRGIGSGFLEGRDGKEANMPLQLNVSCSDFDSYQGAVDRVAHLLRDLYKHYRRYARAKGMALPAAEVSVEEVRRDDLAYCLLQHKAQSPSQHERDRHARRMGQQIQRECTRERHSGLADNEHPAAQGRQRSRERLQEGTDEGEKSPNSSSDLLPNGQPIPTTAAGRRLAAKFGGAEYAAIVSVAARKAEILERERMHKAFARSQVLTIPFAFDEEGDIFQ